MNTITRERKCQQDEERVEKNRLTVPWNNKRNIDFNGKRRSGLKIFLFCSCQIWIEK